MGEAQAVPAFVVVRARDVKPYHFGLWSSVHGGPPFANPIADVSWSDDGSALWLGLESHNFKRVGPDDLLELVDLRGDRLLADSQARYADWVLPEPCAGRPSPFSSFPPY